jgi:diketogulonate reductase-like aldo/keto reductase
MGYDSLMSNRDESVEVAGTRVPALGFGTWLVTGEDAADGVRDALEIGYRQIDTARAYENEREVGRGIADSGVPCDEIFLTTKVPHDDAAADDVRRDAEQSLERLGVDRLDLLLHWPNPDVQLEETEPGVSPIPKASSHARRVENFDVFDFALTGEDRAAIAALPKDGRTANPPWAPDWDA